MLLNGIFLIWNNPGCGHGTLSSPLRELRVQIQGRPLRVVQAFNPKRAAILLVGGSKAGEDRWCEQHAAQADRLYDEHLEELRQEAKKKIRKDGKKL
jgi:hypothetical protein